MSGKQKTPPKFMPGDIVYSKVVQKTLKGAMPFQFQGMAACMLLGHVPGRGVELTENQVIKVLGGCGLVYLDDIADFLGEESAKIFIEKFDLKYYPKVNEVLEVEPVESDQPTALMAPNSLLIDVSKEKENEH